MEPKKNPRLELSRYRTILLEIGLILSLLIVWTAFEWKFYDTLPEINLGKEDPQLFKVEQLDIPITEHTPPPPKTVLEQPEIIEVQNDEELYTKVEANLNLEEDLSKNLRYSVHGDGDADPTEAMMTTPPPPEEEEDIFMVVEEPPTPKGGYVKFLEFVKAHLKYPREARKMAVQGTVFIQFIIGKDGSLSDFNIAKGIGYGCDEEALRVLALAPAWNPGKQRGRAVIVQKVVPIKFQLRGF